MRRYSLFAAVILPLFMSSCGSAKFFTAAESGNVQEVDRLLDAGADVNVRDSRGETPLFSAALSGSKEIAESLIAHGADVNATDRDGLTPLHLAAYQSRREIVKLLVGKSANVNAKTREGSTPLIKAIEWFAGTERGHLALTSRAEIASMMDVVRLLIDNGADVNAADTYDDTPLILAVASGEKSLVELLLARGAAVNSKGHEGVSALYTATIAGQNEIAELLIARGAEVNAGTKTGFTPLGYAARDGNRAMAELLIAHGADMNTKDARYGRTPLVWALTMSSMVSPGRESPVWKQLSAREQADIRKEIYVHKGQWIDVAGQLIDHGADANAADSKGRSPLYLAAAIGDSGLIRSLIGRGAALDDMRAGESPLHAAIAGQRKEAAVLLINGGANVNIPDTGGMTPLHFLSTFMDDRNLAGLMIDHGAGINVRDKDGDTPLDAAISAGNKQVAEALQLRGAKGRAGSGCFL